MVLVVNVFIIVSVDKIVSSMMIGTLCLSLMPELCLAYHSSTINAFYLTFQPDLVKVGIWNSRGKEVKRVTVIEQNWRWNI
jgi:hypothetical protein